MASLIRLLVGVPIAAVITFLLFMLMQRLILTEEVQIEEAGDELRISISEEVEDLQVRQREVTMDDVNDVEPPPPPPQIERQVAEAPSEDMNTIAGEIPEFDAPDLGSGDVSFDVSDRDAQPMVRIPPQYPPRAAERGTEGYCLMQFDVTPDGTRRTSSRWIAPARCSNAPPYGPWNAGGTSRRSRTAMLCGVAACRRASTTSWLTKQCGAPNSSARAVRRHRERDNDSERDFQPRQLGPVTGRRRHSRPSGLCDRCAFRGATPS